MHYVFRSKDELLQAATAQVMATFATAMHHRVDPPAPSFSTILHLWPWF